MSSRTSPTVRRRRLAAEMRRLRKEAGKSREEVAKFAGIAPMTVTRIESAQHAPKPADIAMMCKFYELDEQRTDVLVTLARQSRMRGWWRRYGGTIPDWFEIFVGLEEEAGTIKEYESEILPGIFQTEYYIRAHILAEPKVPAEDEIERRIAVRRRRQERLTADDAPKMWVVLNESVLHREVGGRQAMCEQLQRLVEISELNTVTLQVLPFSAGAHPGTHGGFTILGFPEPIDPDVAYVGYRLGSHYLEQSSEVDIYVTIFDHLRARALGPDESRALIMRIAHQMS